jgi:hypothetical protein
LPAELKVVAEHVLRQSEAKFGGYCPLLIGQQAHADFRPALAETRVVALALHLHKEQGIEGVSCI